MSTRNAAPNLETSGDQGHPKTTGVKVIGWLLIVAAIVPAAMAAHGEGRGPLEIGLILLVGGVGMVVAGRWLTRGR
jgi:hypothetical protein